MNTKKLYIFNLLIKLLPPSRCLALKAKLLRWCGAKVGDSVEIFTPSIYGSFNLTIGDNVFIGHNSLIYGATGSSITIEDNVTIGSRVILVTGSHDYSIKYDGVAGPGKFGNIKICKGACVSTNSLILPGKTVGFKAHVAAGSVVTHDVPEMVRVAGCPARVIKNLRESL